MEVSIPMALAKKATITAKLDLSTGATDYGINLIVNAKAEQIQDLITMLQSEAPVELRFYSPQMSLAEVEAAHE